MIQNPYHNPGHPMHGWPTLERETGLFEALCPHGIGHPIPESVSLMDTIGPIGARGYWSVHGCDGCEFKIHEREFKEYLDG